MPQTSSVNEDAWYIEANCPKYFDFAAALQAPCSLDREYNPPLHDFVYQSDDESDNFFRIAAETSKSPLPKRPQHRMLSPRHFGKPTDKHKPKLSFEDFLRHHESRQRLKNRRSVHIIGDVPTKYDDGEEKRQTATPLQQVDKRSRYRSLPARRNGDSAQRPPVQPPDEEEEDLTLDLKTPTLDSIVTPVTSRRTAHQYTPSRVRNPSNIARSLFTSPRTPLASPVRRMRVTNQKSRPGQISSGELPRLSPEEQSQRDTTSVPQRAFAGADRRPRSLRLPARTTPPSAGDTAPSTNKPSSRGENKSRPYIDRPGLSQSEARLGHPLRTARPSTSVGSSSTITPPVLSMSSSRPVSGSLLAPVVMKGKDGHAVTTDLSRKNAKPESVSRSQGDMLLKERHDHPQVSVTPGSRDADEIDDPELRHKVAEHNKRLGINGARVQPDVGVPSRGSRSRSQRLPQSLRFGHAGSDDEPVALESQGKQEVHPAEASLRSQNEAQKEQAPSLSDLLQSENDRVLEKRKQRLPERRRAMQVSREKVLKRLEDQRQVSVGLQKRTSARVEFTSSTIGEQSKSGMDKVQGQRQSTSMMFKSSRPTNVAASMTDDPTKQKRMTSFRTRTKSAGGTLSGGEQNRNPNLPLPKKPGTSRSAYSKTSRTEQIKAAAKQRREENRLENDLKSMLSQHNNRIKNDRRGRI